MHQNFALYDIVLGMREVVVIAHNLRSTHNVGSILRTADGLGVTRVYFTGYTPYPLLAHDTRLPHIAQKLHSQIRKTALGAEESVDWVHEEELSRVISELKAKSYAIYALEQASDSVALPTFKPPKKIAIVLGREVEGLEQEVLGLCDGVLEIPMDGQKESFNVSIAAGMALFHLRFAK